MCGIVGLFAKSPAIEDRLGEHLAAMLRQMSDRGPDSAGVAVYRDPVAHGHSKLVLCTPRRERGLGGGRPIVLGRHGRPGDPPQPRAADAALRARRRPGARRGAPPRPARDERRRGHRDLQGDGPARALRRALRARRRARLARDRPHAHGDREQGHDRGLASVLDRRGPLPRAQRLALQPQPPAREPAQGGHPLRQRERHRGRRRLPGLAAARGREPAGGARGLPRRPRRLLHVRRRHARRLRRHARPDRLQAGGHGRDRRLGRDGVRVPRDRGAARSRRRALVGARAGARVRVGAGAAWRERRWSRRSTSRRRRCARSTSTCTTSPARAAGTCA